MGLGDTGGEFLGLKTIDTTGVTGNVYISGAGGEVGGAAATEFFGVNGFLASAGGGVVGAGNLALTSVKMGNGNNFLDISQDNLANITALGTTIAMGTGTNTLVTDNTVATSGAALTFYTGVTTLGDANAGAGGAGAINLANLGVNSIDLFGDATMAGAIAITKAGNNFALDIGSADAGAFAIAVTSTTPGSAFVENISIGENDSPDGGPGEYSAVGAMTLTGFGTDNIASIGGGKAGVNFNTINSLLATDATIAPVTVAISGNAELHLLANGVALPTTFIGTQFLGGGPAYSLVEIGNGTFFTDTDTALVRFDGSVFVNSIIATTSGGLVMDSFDTSNSGIIGDLITGSATAANFLAGSLGNDVITMGAGGGAVITEGGGDTITLGAFHGPGDLVDLYVGALTWQPSRALRPMLLSRWEQSSGWMERVLTTRQVASGASFRMLPRCLVSWI